MHCKFRHRLESMDIYKQIRTHQPLKFLLQFFHCYNIPLQFELVLYFMSLSINPLTLHYP